MVPVALVTNDDGIESPGLFALVEELSRSFDVYVAAPRGEMSGTGKSIYFYGKTVRVGRATLRGARGAWWVDTTPAGAVLIAIEALMGEKPDIVVSGINIGPNMGLEDLFTSGTIGAAIEASMRGVHSISASLAVRRLESLEPLARAARIISALAIRISDRKPGSFHLVNANVPVEPRGVKITRLSSNIYTLPHEKGRGYIRVSEVPIEERYRDRPEGSDAWAVFNGFVSLTPLRITRLLEPPTTEAVRELEDLLGDVPLR